ncbi:hypothetical protein [Daejeonella oryzae]|uniref:hypothetical protein n=1 Tax=Daejeonella oryzae TaxID=1122943 RepID=UPI001FE090F5|nr:hypothetical protein [Daejeonella oryzae]
MISSCSTGERLLKKGEYDQAVFKAVARLQKDKVNRTALKTLEQAYQFAVEDHLDNIKDAKISSDILRWENILREYEQLNYLNEKIKGCMVCRQEINSTKYISEINEAKYKAAEIRYARGLKLLEENNRVSAKQAYYDFERATDLYPDFKDSRIKMEDAYWAAVLKVVVEPVQVNSGIYKFSNDYFQNKIYEYLENYEDRSFIKFYTPKEARSEKLIPHQVLSLNFRDFVVGQTYVKERVEVVNRDSVKIGTQNGKDVYGPVKAEVSVFEKTVTSAGLLSFRISDWKSKNIIKEENIPGTYIWQDQWATYKGDKRALNEDQKRLMSGREQRPPAPQDLFIEFTKPIYARLTDNIRQFYSRF